MTETRRESLEHEAEIRWTEDPSTLDYVRELWAYAGTRTKSVPWDSKDQGAGRKVGEAVLERDAPNVSPGRFKRRVFVICEHDRDGADAGPYDDRTAPHEGINPATVAPGVKGKQDARAWGEPLPSSGHEAATQ
jgi:hypothetical protein